MPAAVDLCTLAGVRSFLQKEAADTGQDAEIGTLITSVSTQIIEYCCREFAPIAAAATRRIRVDSPFVSLAPYDLRVATTVTLNPEDASPSVLVANQDYVLEPTNAGLGGTYTSIRLASSLSRSSSFCRSFGYSQLDILGDWGFASIPVDVAQAAVEAVAIRLRRDVSAFSTTFNLDESRLERPEALPRSVCQALAQYKRMIV